MPGFSYVTTMLGTTAQPLGALSDLDVAVGPGGATLYATSRAGQSITAFDLDSGTAAPIGHQSLPAALTPLGGLQVELVELDGSLRAVALSGTAPGLPSFGVTANGALAGNTQYLSATGLGSQLSALATADVGGQQFLFAAQAGQAGVNGFRISGPDAIAAQVGGGAPAGRPNAPEDISAMVTASIGSSSFLFAASGTGDRIYSYQVNGNGALSLTSSIGAAEGLGVNAPTALEQVMVGGQSFLLVASAGSSSISVLQISPNGALTATDHVVDDLTSRFQHLTSFDVVEMDGRAYVIAGGADDGLSLFMLLPNGRLLHLDRVEDQLDSSLQNVSAVRAAAINGQIQVFAGSATEAGLSQFTIAPETAGEIRKAGPVGGQLAGTALADILEGGIGNDQIRAGEGDDIVIGGIGSDQLYGGTGRDIFVLEADGKADQIRDFEIGRDSIDLSGWPMLRGTGQLQISSVNNGGSIRFADENLRIYTADGSSLTIAQIESAIRDSFLHHSVEFLTADMDLTGTNAADILRGRGGDDTLLGGGGADQLFGGEGTDTASYQGIKGLLTVDLLQPHRNTGVAAGDRFDSIENLLGSASRDTFWGDHGDNLISGATNIDVLYGRGGDDELRGGAGQDVLFGGPGADFLRGGTLRDRADYYDSPIGLTIDLGRASNNTGQATGDRYDDIEDLGGTRYKDAIFGDGGDNRLLGREASDRLYGRGGDDQLLGGSQRDWLDGGAGNDDLRGGRQADTFVFREGRDRALDFRPEQGDRIALDADALWSGTLSAAQVVSTFGRIVDGHVVLDFGTDELTLLGVTSLAGLAQEIDLI